MHGRQHLVGIKALEGGLVLSILRYAHELRDPKPYFEHIDAKAEPEAVRLAKDLVKAKSGRFEPEKIPDKYAETLRELLQAKVEQRAPQIEVASEGKAPKEVINTNRAWPPRPGRPEFRASRHGWRGRSGLRSPCAR